MPKVGQIKKEAKNKIKEYRLSPNFSCLIFLIFQNTSSQCT